MPVDVDPSVSLLISEIRTACNDDAENLMIYEIKNMAAKNNRDDESLIIEVWKKLYLQSKGINVNPLDFIRVSASKSLFLKRMGYQGLVATDCTKQLIMMPNTLSKDFETEPFSNEALIFMANVYDKLDVLAGTSLKIQIPKESGRLYCKSIVAKSKYSNELLFSITSSKDITLLVKLQIILDKNLTQQITSNDVELLKSMVFGVKCPFTMLKVLQTLQKVLLNGRLSLGERWIQFLKDMIILPHKKTKRQIEIGLAIEAAHLLIMSRNVCERIEEFVFRLINSENMNSRFLGFKLVSAHRIIPEMAINRIIELGLAQRLYVDTFIQLIDRFNYKIIYKKIDELSVENIANKSETIKYMAHLSLIIGRLCTFQDPEFICKVLYENPKVYPSIRDKNPLIREQSKSLFKMIVSKLDKDYFLMIYDLFPAKTRSHEKISSMCAGHLNLLVDNLNFDSTVFDALIDFMCTHGDPLANRRLIRDILSSKIDSIDAKLRERLVESIIFFNIILPKKVFHLRKEIFIDYSLDGEFITIEYPSSIKNVTIFNQESISEQTEDNKIVKVYRIEAKDSVIIKICDKEGNFENKLVV